MPICWVEVGIEDGTEIGLHLALPKCDEKTLWKYIRKIWYIFPDKLPDKVLNIEVTDPDECIFTSPDDYVEVNGLSLLYADDIDRLDKFRRKELPFKKVRCILKMLWYDEAAPFPEAPEEEEIIFGEDLEKLEREWEKSIREWKRRYYG